MSVWHYTLVRRHESHGRSPVVAAGIAVAASSSKCREVDAVEQDYIRGMVEFDPRHVTRAAVKVPMQKSHSIRTPSEFE